MLHAVMMYMHILRKRFSEAGLCDVLIQSGTIAERSIDKADKVIEMTLNKDTKIPVNHDVCISFVFVSSVKHKNLFIGGCAGFSTNINAVKRWEINAVYTANIQTIFHKLLNCDVLKYKHPDLNPSRIKKDQDPVDNILGILETTFIDSLSPLSLMCILAGVVTNEKVTKDTLLPETLVEAVMRKFLDIGLGEQRAPFFRSN